jgi:hypothetical protein
MFILESKETIAKAIERAKDVHPKVTVKAFGEYEVTGSTGARYTVKCARRGSLKVVDCDCVAGTFGSVCFHAASAIPLHIYMASKRAAA